MIEHYQDEPGIYTVEDHAAHWSVQLHYPNTTVTVYRISGEGMNTCYEELAEFPMDTRAMKQTEKELADGKDTPDGWEDGAGNTIRI
ncbi:hypothetical protein [Sporolactobacillus putidus]|uniref:Uncharacterized protein n=1 Tax=Sporolactobacillus putidus TaxID=492735 RepID=A0A917S585_9BACL|nr:hypothetical protein [Sporolactobacillus putidus]GGL58085.1 hypothetical protein GCM10007968_22640 [Sporolactobacillus putidus]